MLLNPHWNPDVLYHQTAPVDGVFDITGLDLTGYQRVALYMDGITATGAVDLVMHTYIDGGLRAVEGHVWRASAGTTANGDGSFESSVGTGFGVYVSNSVDLGSGAGQAFSGCLELSVPPAKYPSFSLDAYAIASSGVGVRYTAAGHLTDTGRLTGFALVAQNGGLLSGGTITVYAMKKALGRAPDPITAAVQSLWTGDVA